MIKYFLMALSLTMLPFSMSYASTHMLSNDPTDSQQLEYWELLDNKTEQAMENITPSTTLGTTSSSNAIPDIIAPSAGTPTQLENMLRKALNQHDPERIQTLSNAYRTLPSADQLLLKRAEGLILRYRHQYRDAINIYENLSLEHPDNQRVRLDLAIFQFENRQWRDAAENFARLAAVENLSSSMRRNIKPYQVELDNRTGWRWTSKIGITYNTNVDDTPPPHCFANRYCIDTKAESGIGLDYHIDVSKLTPLGGHHSLLLKSSLNGTSYYFDRKSQHDNASGRVYMGWQWQDWRNTLTLLPFYQARLAGSEDFRTKPLRSRRFLPYMASHAVGAQARFIRTLSPRWQAHFSLEGYRQFYRESRRARRYDGWQANTFASLTYRASPTTTLFTNIQHSRLMPKNRFRSSGRINNAAYHRNKIGVGWRQYWANLGGLESSLSVSYRQTRYRGTASSTDITQKNRELSYSLALSHKRWEIAGFEPSLNVQYSRTRSNVPWSERKRTQFFIELERHF